MQVAGEIAVVCHMADMHSVISAKLSLLSHLCLKKHVLTAVHRQLSVPDGVVVVHCAAHTPCKHNTKMQTASCEFDAT